MIQGLKKSFTDNLATWKTFFDEKQPQYATLPAPYDTLKQFERMMILRCIRPDKIVPAVQTFVEGNSFGRDAAHELFKRT